MKNGKLTWQEKAEYSNKYIKLYRETNREEYKALAFEIIDPDVRKFCRTNFYMYPHLMEDIIQNALFLVLKHVNKGTSFDPEKGVYIVTYLQSALKNVCRLTVDKDKTSAKYDPKKRIALIKKLQAIVEEKNLRTIQEAIPFYINMVKPNLTEEERSRYEYKINSLIAVTTSTKIPDDRQDDDAIHSELVDESSDFTDGLETVYTLRRKYHVASMLFDKKQMSRLQFSTFNAVYYSFLHGYDMKKSELARRMGMTRQNFCRAFNEAKKVVDEYINTHDDDDK